MKRIAIILGTRPELIKIYPIHPRSRKMIKEFGPERGLRRFSKEL